MPDPSHIILTPEERSQYRAWMRRAEEAVGHYNGSEVSEQRLFEPLLAMDDFIRGKNAGAHSDALERSFAQQAQAAPDSSLAHVEFDSDVKQGRVFRLRDQKTGEVFYAKPASPAEIANTRRAAHFQLPVDSPLVLPQIAGEFHDLPQSLQQALIKQATEKRLDAADTWPINKESWVITRESAFNKGMNLNLIYSKALMYGELPPTPLSAANFDTLIRSIQAMNDAGIIHSDIEGNLAMTPDGKFHLIDFDPNTGRNKVDDTRGVSDIAVLRDYRKKLTELGAIVETTTHPQQRLPQQQQQSQSPFDKAAHDRQAQQLAEFHARQTSAAVPENVPSITATNRSPLEHVSIESIVKENSVWRLRDSLTGKVYYVKRASVEEVNLTRRVANILLPQDSPLILPKIAGQFEELPPSVQKFLGEEAPFNSKLTQFLVTKEVPSGANLANFHGGLSYSPKPEHADRTVHQLRGKPITAAEYDGLITAVHGLNEAGISHQDIQPNTFPHRDANGRLRFTIIDFEDRPAIYPDQDLMDLKEMRGWLEQSGVVETPMNANADTKFTRYRATTVGTTIQGTDIPPTPHNTGDTAPSSRQIPNPQQQQQGRSPLDPEAVTRQVRLQAEANARQIGTGPASAIERPSQAQESPDVKHTASPRQQPLPQQQQQANAGHVTSELPIILHQGVSDAFVSAVRDRVSQLPAEVQSLIADAGWRVRVIKNATQNRTKWDTLEVPEIRASGAAAIKGEKDILFFEYQLNPLPRPGTNNVVATIYKPGSDFDYVVRHEFGHAIDREFGISTSAVVTQAYNNDTAGMLPEVRDRLNYYLTKTGLAEVVADQLADRIKHWSVPKVKEVPVEHVWSFPQSDSPWALAHPSIDAAFDGVIKAHAATRQNPQLEQQQQARSPTGQSDIAAHPTDKPVYRVDTASTSRPSVFPRQFTILMDTDHGDITMLRMFRDTLRNFVTAGGKHLIVEQESVYQEIFEMVRSGQARLGDFDGILHASAYIPEHHQAEAQSIAREVMQIALKHDLEYTATDFTPKAVGEFPDIHELILRLNSSPNKAEANAEFGRLMSDPKFKERFERFNTMFMADRRASDAHLISEIAGKVKPNEKALVFYGSDHGFHLAQGLGIERSQGVLLTNSETDTGRARAERLVKMPLLTDEPPVSQRSKISETSQVAVVGPEQAQPARTGALHKVGHTPVGEPTNVDAIQLTVETEANPKPQPVQTHDVARGKPSSAKAQIFDTPPPKTPSSVAPHSGRVAANATRAGGAAGGVMGAMGIAGRLNDTLDKAQKVGGKQLETEHAALGGDIASVVTGMSDLTPGAAQAASKAGVALRAMGRVAPIVAAGAAYLEVQAANTAQDGRRGSGAVGGFAGGMGVGMATGATAGAILGPWGAAIGGIVGGFGAGYVGSEIGRSSQWGDQRQRDLDHKAQYALDQSVEVIAELGHKRLRGQAWTDADKAAMRTIGGLMVEHITRMQVLAIPATDIDGRLRQQYQIQQTQHVIDYLNGKTERLPMTSQQRDAHLIPSIDALLPELNDPKLGWKPWLNSGAGAVDRNDVLRTLSEYGIELHTLDKDGRKGVTIDELTNVLKALKVDQRGKVTPARGAAHVERPPEINDEIQENFRDGMFEKTDSGQKRFEAAMASWIPELEKAGFGKTLGGADGKITPEKLGEAMKRSGLRASEVDQDGNGNITEREAINALRAHGLDRPEQKGR